MANDTNQAQGLFLRFGGQDYVEHRKQQLQQHPEYKATLSKRKAKLLERLNSRVSI